MSRASFFLGETMGWLAAPALALASFARSARALHPRGVTYRASVTPRSDATPAFAELSRRLEGSAIVRFSAALWKRVEGVPDVLGCALRVEDDERGASQDLLFATIRRPWTMPFAPFTTHVRDYLANDYFAVSPFRVGGGARIYLRVHPTSKMASPRAGESRAEKLLRDVRGGHGELSLEASAGPFGPWSAVATVTLRDLAHVDDEALRFSPFRTGRSIRPVGFIHGLRVGTYRLSQRARPSHAMGPGNGL